MAYKPDKHGRDHCPGGEDPIPCLGQAAILTSWESIATGEVAPDIWTAVTADGFYNDGYQGIGFFIDLDDGTIGGQQDVLYWAIGYVQINEELAPGEMLAVSVFNEPEGAGHQLINQLTASSNGDLSDNKLTVAGPIWTKLGTISIALYVFHNSAATVSIREATLTVHSVGPLHPNNWQVHA